MVDLLSVVLIVAGLVLLFGGAALSVYGVALLGMAIGGGMGYLVAPTIGGLIGVDGPIVVVIVVGIGLVLGAALSHVVLSMTISILGFAVGAFFGRVVIAPALFDAAWYLDWGVGLVVGIAAAMAAVVYARTVLVIVTSALGAALASHNVTIAGLTDAQDALSLDPLSFGLFEPLFLALLILGLLAQFGLFKLGYVTKLVKRLPGASIISDRR